MDSPSGALSDGPLHIFAIFKSFFSNQVKKGSISFESVDLTKGNGLKKRKNPPFKGDSGFPFVSPPLSLYLQKCCFVFSKQMRILRLAAQDKIAPLLTKWNTFFCGPKKSQNLTNVTS